jgi:hypothetical protein
MWKFYPIMGPENEIVMITHISGIFMTSFQSYVKTVTRASSLNEDWFLKYSGKDPPMATASLSIIPECIRKLSDLVDNEINNNKHSLRSNTKCYGGKTH